jgi:hypothetical protein
MATAACKRPADLPPIYSPCWAYTRRLGRDQVVLISDGTWRRRFHAYGHLWLEEGFMYRGARGQMTLYGQSDFADIEINLSRVILKQSLQSLEACPQVGLLHA